MSKYFYGAIFLVLALVFYSCTLQPGSGNGGGNTSSTGISSSSPGTLSVVYVATNGSDTNSGANKTEPFKNIQKAVDTAADGAVINVAQGIYTNGDGLNYSETGSGIVILNKKNIRLIGGWNEDFSETNGYSELDGNKELYHIIFISNSSHIFLDGFVLRNGNATNVPSEYKGGGVFVIKSSNCTLSNGIISNNIAKESGGGIYISKCFYNTINMNIYNNSAGYAGGMLADHCTNTAITGNVNSNSGGGLEIDYSSNTVINCGITGNNAVQGGGIYFFWSPVNTVGGNISSNTALYDGGGIYFNNCPFTSVNAVIAGNSANRGGGLYVENGTSHSVINGNITGNTAQLGGGVYIYWVFYDTIDANITGNTAICGGGIFLEFLWNNTITGNISSNSAANGGGIYIGQVTTNNLITNSRLLYNQADHGAICIGTNTVYTSLITNNSFNILAGNTIGGQGAGYGIYEMGLDFTNHTMTGNIFLTNTLGLLYHDFADGDTGLDEIAVLNTVNDPRHDASTASGNIVSNE